MSKGLSIFLTVLALFGWSWFSHWWYTCKIKESCGCAQTSEVVVANAKRFPLDFSWNNATANTNEGFDKYKQGYIDELPDKDSLYIIGRYFEGEEAPAGFKNMGLARAAAVRAKFSPPIDSKIIRLKSLLVKDVEADKKGYFEAVKLDWIEKYSTLEKIEDANTSSDKAVASGKDNNGETNTAKESKATISSKNVMVRFPFNSTTQEFDQKVEDYLVELGVYLKKTGDKVSLTGHTDNIGDDASNMRLGAQRANKIRAILRKAGVNRNQIITSSKGESQPVATNDTDLGRQKNRRVEIKVLNN